MLKQLKNIFAKLTAKSTRSLTVPAYYALLPSSFLTGNVVVNEDTALANTAAWRALRLLGEAMARTVKTVRRKDGTNWLIDDNHYLNDVLHYPNEIHTNFTFFETVTAFTALYGNGYAYIVRDPGYRPIQLIPLHPMHVQAVSFYNEYYYDITLNSGQVLSVDPADMIHLTTLNMSAPHVMGKSPFQIHRDDFKLGAVSKSYGVDFYENGAHLQGYLHTPEYLSDKEIDEISTKFDSSTKGVGSLFSTPVLHSGLDYKPVKLTPRDALFIEISILNIQDISRIFGIPIHLLSQLENSSFNNVETQSFEYQEYTIEPWASRWKAELDKKLIPLRKRRTMEIMVDTTPLRAGDFDARASFYTKLFSVGALSSNDIRKREGFNPRAGGDEYYTPVNVFSDEEREVRMKANEANIEKSLNFANNANSEAEMSNNGQV